MITVDPRAGSGELHPLFPPGMSRLAHIDYADFAFTGRGPAGVPWLVGVERKVVRDLLASIVSGRLSGHQLIGLLNSYNAVYIVVEGGIRPHPSNGMLQMHGAHGWHNVTLGTRRFMYRDVVAYMETLGRKCGTIWYQTAGREETVALILALQNWWVGKDYAAHRAHLADHKGAASLTQHSLVRRVAAQLPGVGWERAQAVDAAVSSIAGMVGMTEAQWREIPGIGKGIAARLVRELGGNGG